MVNYIYNYYTKVLTAPGQQILADSFPPKNNVSHSHTLNMNIQVHKNVSLLLLLLSSFFCFITFQVHFFSGLAHASHDNNIVLRL